ncbi:MAG: hypothetical protein JJ894_00160 [Dinoroseobacter sp.]|nr:hypothetical protein [Dinoroseobacter sp.]
MMNYLTSTARGLWTYWSNGIGQLTSEDGSLLRYEIEERLASQSDSLVSKAFQRQIDDSSLPRDDLLHFMIFARNIHMFFLQSHFTRITVLQARLFQSSERVDPKTPGAISLSVFTIAITLQISLRLIASMLKSRMLRPLLQEPSEQTDGATLVVPYFIGVSPNYRNDMFWLTRSTAERVGKVVLIGRSEKELAAAKLQIGELQAAWSQQGVSIPKIVTASLYSAPTPGFFSSAQQALSLKIDSTKTGFLERCLLRTCHLYYARHRDAYAYFLESSQAVAVTNTNLSFLNAAISGAALRSSSLSIFRERSVWGNWSRVHRNKIICDCFSALSSTSKAFLEGSNPHITNIYEQEIQTLPHAVIREPQAPSSERVFRILLLGSNISKNKTNFPPQVIPDAIATRELGSFSKWAIIQEDLLVRIKEKKDGPAARSIRSIVLESADGGLDDTFSGWEETARITPHQFANDIDLAIAIGTFYPSALHELTSLLPKERCLFWDITGLTSKYPSIPDAAPISVAESLEEVQAHILRLKASEDIAARREASTNSGNFESWLLETLGEAPAFSNGLSA